VDPAKGVLTAAIAGELRAAAFARTAMRGAGSLVVQPP
jgi:hypothetical protein